MEDINIVEILITIILCILGFMLNRLYGSVDNLVKITNQMKLDINDRPDFEKSEEISDKSSMVRVLKHESSKHHN